MSITRSLGGESSKSTGFRPAAGGSSGSGSYFTDPEINPHSQAWQTPVRQRPAHPGEAGDGDDEPQTVGHVRPLQHRQHQELLWIYYGLLILSRPVIVWKHRRGSKSAVDYFRFARRDEKSLIGGEHLVRAAECAAGHDRCGRWVGGSAARSERVVTGADTSLGGPTSRFHRVPLRSICFRRCTLSLQPGIPRPRQLLRRYGVGWAMIAAEEASADPSVARPGPTRLRHAGSNFQGPHCGPRS